MVRNRYFRHVLFILLVISIIAITPKISEAHIELQTPTNNEEVNLSVKFIPEEEPLRIQVPARNIDIDIEHAEVENGTWEVPEFSAGYADGSSYLDEEHGNSIVFAHARNGMFRDLLNVQLEDEIIVMGTKNIYKYKITSIEKILPDEIDKIRSLGDHNLTLFTCEGINDEYRLLVKAERIDIYSMLSSSEII